VVGGQWSVVSEGMPRVTVKICGLTCVEDALDAREAGADYLGFVFFPASRRCLDEGAAEWIAGVPGRKVGIFRDQPRDVVERVRDAIGLDLVQLHGDETAAECEALGGRERVIKAISVRDRVDWVRVGEYAAAARILFDTASPTGGGTGAVFDWTLLDGRPAGLEPWLAGGLRPENVGDAIARVQPAGVDVASGVERSVGRKDPARIRAFIAAVREIRELTADS
jgi:phosphoribosylanthranilate isomerase